jgi:hypothetical protein
MIHIAPSISLSHGYTPAPAIEAKRRPRIERRPRFARASGMADLESGLMWSETRILAMVLLY